MSQDGAQGRYAGRAVAGGRYQLRDLLGEGGMASVHLAYDTVLDRQVAIKTLHTELGREAAFRERFRREAQSVAKLTHTNIVSVFDTGEDDLDGTATPYIVMEYVEGRPLGSVLDEAVSRQGAMPADQALKITADVLAALEISHEMGLVHRDIKPGNVMMTKRGVVKVMDFGIARAMQSGVTSMTQTGMVVGTPQYLSPEQALGRGVDARSDLYSVGIMLFQLVTGRLPFEADSPLAIAYAHVQEEPVAPSSVNRALPPAVDALVARALKKNPNERFPTAEAMRDECLRIAQSLQPAAPSIVPGQQTQSGAGVGSAVFPPVGQQPPSTGPVQTPYQPGPYGAQTPAPAQHHPAPTPTPGYGYPQQSGYGTPQPYGHQQAPATPPPYATVQQSGSGSTGGKRQMPLIVGSIVVALLAIGGLVTALALQKDDDPQAGGSGDPGSSQGEGKDGEKPGFRGPDLTKTMETEECTDPDESYNDPEKIRVPDFTFTNITFVKKCLQAAKWKYDTTSVDENAYGKDTVMRQSPKAGTEVDPDDMPSIQLDVSSGNPS
ncbi:protein kinase domain-containing protein [Streptomyces albidoflavus]|uniref:protein kinase domain-containing protein n=1 Tax=Streptomyces TaxID=1883 RepID=UPI00101221A7|nr:MULTISPECIES: protein kinase [Streptomyces]MCU7704495.1 protein kinase [Streptomyces albidoflavus]RZD84489.1 serine/threonine protein kinase [Streptomyces albidoflavus]RZE00124.1 serine/threonine protein kinase [Streptomyces albidoflavus]RZE01397.1 serine/threonine protein kinase [Streptomyces albidoflavus]RZE20883.1 serine/threonine protein kinase [Streptomyces albidoflavus]